MTWLPTTVKWIHPIGEGAPSAGSVPSQMPVISWPEFIGFNGLSLCASVARTKASARAAPSLIAALAESAKLSICALVDNVSDKFSLTSEIENLSDSAHNSMSAELGCAITDLLMLSAGFVYRDNARTVIKHGTTSDFLYAGRSQSHPPLSSNGAVLVEAKGQFRKGGIPSSLKYTVREAFAKQVNPFVGKSFGSTHVYHGCAVGAGATIGKSDGQVYLVQSPGSAAPASSKNPTVGEKSAAPAPFEPQTNAEANAGEGDNPAIVLGNSRALLNLTGRVGAAAAVQLVQDAYVRGSIEENEREQVKALIDQEFAFADSTYLGEIDQSFELIRGVRFSLNAEIARAIRVQMVELLFGERIGFQLPRLDFNSQNDVVTFPDGLSARLTGNERSGGFWPGGGPPETPAGQLGYELPVATRSLASAEKLTFTSPRPYSGQLTLISDPSKLKG